MVVQPVGTRRIYRVDQDGLAALRADLERFWGQALANYKAVVEQSTRRKHDDRGTAHVGPDRDRRRGAGRARLPRVHGGLHGSSRPSTTCWVSRSPKPCSSPARAGACSTAASTAANSTGRECWLTSRRTGSSSAGTSARSGSSSPTRRRRARSRSGLSPSPRSHADRAGTPQPRPPRRGLAGDARCGRWRGRLATLPTPVRRPVNRAALS